MDSLVLCSLRQDCAFYFHFTDSDGSKSPGSPSKELCLMFFFIPETQAVVMFRINHQFSMVFLSSPPFLCMVYDVLCISVSCQLVSVGLRCYSCLQSTPSHFFAAPNGPFLEDLVRLRHGRPWPVGAWDVHSGDAVATTPGLAGQHGGFFRHVLSTRGYQGVPRNARSFFGITQKKRDMVLESHWLRNSGLSHYSIEAMWWSSCKMLFLPICLKIWSRGEWWNMQSTFGHKGERHLQCCEMMTAWTLPARTVYSDERGLEEGS